MYFKTKWLNWKWCNRAHKTKKQQQKILEFRGCAQFNQINIQIKTKPNQIKFTEYIFLTMVYLDISTDYVYVYVFFCSLKSGDDFFFQIKKYMCFYFGMHKQIQTYDFQWHPMKISDLLVRSNQHNYRTVSV